MVAKNYVWPILSYKVSSFCISGDKLLSLVNKLLGLNHSTLKKDLFVTRYSIIPLSVNTGLIGWVE